MSYHVIMLPCVTNSVCAVVKPQSGLVNLLTSNKTISVQLYNYSYHGSNCSQKTYCLMDQNFNYQKMNIHAEQSLFLKQITYTCTLGDKNLTFYVACKYVLTIILNVHVQCSVCDLQHDIPLHKLTCTKMISQHLNSPGCRLHHRKPINTTKPSTNKVLPAMI